MGRTSALSDETEKLFVNEIRKYPEIWKNRNRGVRKQAVWGEIGEKFGFPSRMARILWSSFRRRYYDILLMRTIQRDNRVCTWHLFHHMTFIYALIKELIEERMGGISPPLLKPNKSKSAPRLPCPCCMTGVKIDTDNDMFGFRSKNSLKRPIDDVKDSSNRPSLPAKKRKRSAYIASSLDRERIIDAIKDYPALYAKDSPGPKCSISYAWKMVAEKVGLPLLVIQNRWRFFRKRYVDELMKERYANGEPFQSKWENFEQMSFMREHMQADIENIDRIREEIQQIVREQKSRQTIDLCADEDDIDPIENENRNCIFNADRANDRANEPERYVERYQIDHVNLSIQPAEANLSKVKPTSNYYKENHPILTLDLISDEEDNDGDIISIGDYESSITDSGSGDVNVYLEDSVKNDVICIDDDEAEGI